MCIRYNLLFFQDQVNKVMSREMFRCFIKAALVLRVFIKFHLTSALDLTNFMPSRRSFVEPMQSQK